MDLVSKLRVIHSVTPDCTEKARELDILPLEHGRRPFKEWYQRNYFKTLAQTQVQLQQCGITVTKVREQCGPEGKISFQRAAETLIKKALAEPYYRDSRIRAKCFQWKFAVLPGHLERRVVSRLSLLRDRCPPRALAVYFRSLWNGWVCHERMKAILPKRPCVLGCGWEDDGLGHYLCCGFYWQFVRKPRPSGLGLAHLPRSRDSALLVAPELGQDDAIRMAAGIYALYRTVNHIRFSDTQFDGPGSLKLMKSFSRRGLENNRAFQLLLS